MKHSYKSFLLFFFLILSGDLLYAQWVQTSGPGGGIIHGLAASDDYLFAAPLYGGIFRSSDNGANWIPSNNGLPDHRNFSRIAVTEDLSGNDIVFVGAWTGGVFRSFDNGNSWEGVNNGLNNNMVLSIVADPDRPEGIALFVGTSGGVFRSTNFGDSWTATSYPLYASANTLACFKDTVGNSYLFAGTGGSGIYLSINDLNWVNLSNGLTNYEVNSIKIYPDGRGGANIFACTHGGGVCLSTDFGLTWVSSSNGITSFYTSSITLTDSSLFIGTYRDGVFCSTNNGLNWISVNNGIDDLNVISLDTHGGGVFAGTWNGVFRSTNLGDTWMDSNNGLAASLVSAMVVSDTNLFVGIWGGRGVFRFNKHNNVWIPPDEGLTDVRVWSLASVNDEIEGAYIFAGTYFDGIFRSNNSGANWVPVNNGLLELDILSFTSSPNDSGSSKLFAGTADGVFFSTNYGENWTSAGLLLYVQSLASFPNGIGGTNIFAGGYGGGVYLSTDNGESWVAVNNGLTNFQINTIAGFYHPSGYTDLYVGTGGGGVFRSTDYGFSWVAVNTGLSELLVHSLAVIPTGNDTYNIAAGIGYEGGVYISANQGANWNSINDGFPRIDVISLTVFDSKLFGGTYGLGVWSRPLSEITSVEPASEKDMPLSFNLSQNFPNPFNPLTTIQYDMPYSSKVSIVVYDILGNELVTLINEEKNAGTYQVIFDGSGLASGVYFYRLKAGGFIQTKKFVLLQ